MNSVDQDYIRIVQRGNRQTDKFVRVWFRSLVVIGVLISILSVMLLGFYPELSSSEAGAAPVILWNFLIVAVLCFGGSTVALLRVIARSQQHHLNAWDEGFLNLLIVLYLFAIAMCGCAILTGSFVFRRTL